ncbi:hypothetical protein N2152v2_005061 [Parachlorella kessleri]
MVFLQDPAFDVALLSASTAPPQTEAPQRPQEQQPLRGAASSPATNASSRGGAIGSVLQGLLSRISGRQAQLALLVANICIVLSAAVSLVPLNRALAYRSTDFFYLMTAMLMTQNPAMWLGVIPLAILAAYQASATLNSEFGGTTLWRRVGLRGHQWLAANKETALRACALAEVLMGFQAVLSVFQYGLRTAMLAYVYWNQLRLRFWAPESRANHVWAWTFINAKAQPLLTAVPALHRYIGFVKRWFDQPMAQQQARGR